MTQRQPVSILDWNFAHGVSEWPVDAVLEPPLALGDPNLLWHLRAGASPPRTPLVFKGFFDTLNLLDYPSNDCNWPLVTRRMLDALQLNETEHCTPYPTTLIDVQLRTQNDPRWTRTDPQAASEYALSTPSLFRTDLYTLQITPLHGVLNRERSRCEIENDFIVSFVDSYVFHELETGFPPLFRVAEDPATLFISDEARQSLKTAGIVGPVYRAVDGFQPPAQTDVPLPFSEGGAVRG